MTPRGQAASSPARIGLVMALVLSFAAGHLAARARYRAARQDPASPAGSCSCGGHPEDSQDLGIHLRGHP